MKKIRFYLFPIFILGFGLAGNAFMLPQHRTLTDFAIQHLQACGVTAEQWEIIGRIQDMIISGNIDEDKGSWTERATNWHFFGADPKSTAEKVGLVKVQIHDRFNQLERRLHAVSVLEDLNRENKNQILARIWGGLIHYLQDASVPAHIVPVLHGVPVFSKLADELDSYPINISRLREKIGKDCYPQNAKKVRSPSQVLVWSIAQTRAALEQTVRFQKSGKLTSIPWARFWLSPVNKDFFGSYNPELPPFGVEAFKNSSGDMLIFKKEDFDQFAFLAHWRAIQSTAIFLHQQMNTDISQP